MPRVCEDTRRRLESGRHPLSDRVDRAHHLSVAHSAESRVAARHIRHRYYARWNARSPHLAWWLDRSRDRADAAAEKRSSRGVNLDLSAWRTRVRSRRDREIAGRSAARAVFQLKMDIGI